MHYKRRRNRIEHKMKKIRSDSRTTASHIENNLCCFTKDWQKATSAQQNSNSNQTEAHYTNTAAEAMEQRSTRATLSHNYKTEPENAAARTRQRN